MGDFGHLLLKQRDGLPIPAPCEDLAGGGKAPYFVVGDAAFSLKENLLTPYRGRLLSE